MKDFSSSLRILEQPPVVVPPLSTSSLNHPDNSADEAFEQHDDGCYSGEDEIGNSRPSSFLSILRSQQFDDKSSPPFVASQVPKTMNKPVSRSPTKPSTSHLLTHKDLDSILFHQMLAPYIPSLLANQKSPSYNFLSSLLPLDSAKASSSLLTDAAHDQEEADDESSAGSSLGSYQSLDADGDDLDAAQGLHNAGNESSNWMVAKRHLFAARESRQSPATPQLHAELRLLKLLNKHKAPLKLFPAIQQWARESANLQHDFTRPCRTRVRVLSELEERYDMQSSRFTPTIVSYLPDERPTVVYVASFADAVYSLLSDPELMKEDNLSFPDSHNPFLLDTPTDPNGPTRRKPDLSQLHHGTWHRATHKARCTGPKDVLCPVIFYIDGVATDTFGRLGLCPLNFTLGIFNAATRTRKEAWVTIYYHPDDAAEASLHQNPTSSFHKCQNLHRGLDAAFAEFREITRQGGLCWDNLRYGGQVHDVNFKFALAFVVGDTEMHDKLCGKTVNRSNNAQCLCRHCDVPLAETINPDHPRHLFTKATFDRRNAANDLDYFAGISHHPGLVNAFHRIDMGENIHNIHLASPGELLHMHQKGPMMRFVEGLEHLIKAQGTDSDEVGRNINKSLKNLNSVALHYGALLSRGSDRDLPRTKFKNSLFSGTKKAAHEQAGVLLDLLVALVSDRGRQILEYDRTLDPRFVGDQISMCELCLGIQQWMKKPSITRSELRLVPDAMAYFITFQERVTIRGGMGSLLVKNHLFFHLFDYLKTWGPLGQMNSGPSESHHKTEVKAPSMNTQRRPATFIQQCSQRYTELRVIRKACQKLGVSDQQLLDNRPVSVHPVHVPVTGAYYSLGLINDAPSMRWDSKSHKHRAVIHTAVIELVCEVILPLVSPLDAEEEACVPCFTEHKRWDGTQHIIWRAHPCYRSKETHPKDVWYDWALWKLEDDFGGELFIPCQILCFMDLSKQPQRKRTRHDDETLYYRGYAIGDPTQYAVVRKFKEEPTPLDYTSFLEWGELEDGFFIFPCDSIYEPLCVVPNMPMLPWPPVHPTKKPNRNDIRRREAFVPIGGYFTVMSMTGWEEWFTDKVIFERDDEED
jgi:hypothetical protein